MNVMDVLEVRIIEYCNYHCVACGAFSNIAKKEEYGVEQYEKDLIRMSNLFDQIGLFRIYGGEPFVAKNLVDYVKITRDVLKDSKIEIVTNGSLLYKVDEKILELLQDLDIKIVISYYDAENEKVNQGIARIDQKQMEYELVPTRHFYAIQDFTQKHDAARSRKMCVVSIASYLHGSRLYACPFPFSYVHYDEKYGTSYTRLEDGIDIYDTKLTAKEILKKLQEPMKFCENCVHIPRYVKWQQNQPEENDWFACECNTRLDQGYKYYDFLIDVDKLKYLVINISQDRVEYCMQKEADFDLKKRKVVLIDSYYSRLLYDSTFVYTAKKLNLEYVILDSETEDLKKIYKYYQKYERSLDIILFALNLQQKTKIVKKIKKIIVTNEN